MENRLPLRELRNYVSEVLRRVERGETFIITVNRRPVARLVPIRKRRTVPFDEAVRLASRHQADERLLHDLKYFHRTDWDDS